MGVSIQQYRITVQSFNQSNIFSYRFSKPKYRKCRIIKNKSYPNLALLVLVCLCSLSMCWGGRDLQPKTKSQSLHSQPIYPASLCTDVEQVSIAEKLYEWGVRDHSGQGGQVQQLQLDEAHVRITSRFKFRKCILLTKSLVIDDYNFLARYKYGNKSGGGIKLCHWNKGSSFLENSINEIEQIIAEYKPHILGISESNFLNHHRLENVQIEDYNIFLADTLKNPQLNISRVAVYVHKDVVVQVRHDLMTDSFSSVWLEVGLGRQKKFLVSNIYRDWKYMGQGNQESGTMVAQLSSWESFIQKCEMAIASGKEIHVMGDTNLDYLDFNKDAHELSDHAAQLRPLVNALQVHIIPHGFLQLMNEVTRIWPGQDPSLLDQHWTNRPEKISSVNSFHQGSSDHKLIISMRHTKTVLSKPRLIRKRCFKDFSPDIFIEAVKKLTWFEVYMTEDTESAVNMVTKKLTAIIDVLAPIKTIQTRTHYAPWLSKATKKKINERNSAQKKAARTNLESDWKEYKKKRNKVNSILKTEKTTWQEKKVSEFGSDSSSIWKNLKRWLCWSKGGPPSKLIDEGIIYTKPADLARVMNLLFVNKVQKLHQKLTHNPGDPISLVQEAVHLS